MKRFGFITLAVLTAVFFSSCNDSDGDYASSWAFASAETLSNDYYFVLDDDKTVYPSDKSRVAGYKPEDDQRVIIFFNLLKTGVEGYDYNIALYDVRNIYTGETRIVTTQEEVEELPDAQTSYFGGSMNSNWLNVGIGFNASDLSKHKFLLVRNDFTQIDPDNKKAGYLNLELRHDAGTDTSGVYSSDDRYVSFKLDQFKEDLEGMNGIILRMNTRQNGVIYLQINMSKEK